MAWREELAADLPDPRPSDPPALRDDILDELSDHLACAADRERLRGGDETDVVARVRERFGDPARIARQLWLDALKERLMRERITIVFAAVLAVAAAIACGLLWSAVRDTRESLATALEQNRLAAARNAESNAALLARIEDLSRQADQPPALAMEWNPVRVKLVKGENGTEPAVGYSASLTGDLYKGGERSSITETADEDGRIDFGRVQPGRYSLKVSTPWDAYKTLSLQVAPGTSVEKTIACPVHQIVETNVRLEIEWPDDLPDVIESAVVTISGPVQPFAGDDWALPGHTEEFIYQVPRDGTVTRPRELATDNRLSAPFGPRISGTLGEIKLARLSRGSDGSPFPPRPWYGWRTARYSLSGLALISEQLVRRSSALRSSSSGFARFGDRQPTPVVAVVSVAATSRDRGDDAELVHLGEAQSFTPAPGKPNVWRIRLPSEMVEQAQERIEHFESALIERQQQRPVEAPRSSLQ